DISDLTLYRTPQPITTLFPSTTLFRSHARHRPLEDLEEPLLHALARYVARDARVLRLAGDLVDLVDVHKIARKSENPSITRDVRSEEHTSELQSRGHLVCRLLLEKKKR